MSMWVDSELLSGITPHQQQQLLAATEKKVGCLTGGPGVGKTHTVAALISAIQSSGQLGHVAVCAPTGKAAVRLTEELERRDIPLQATTIHRLLGISVADKHRWTFKYNSVNPLPARYVIVDEASMLGAELGASLFAAAGRGGHVLLVGDQGQLPPIGHGCVLRDLVNSGAASVGNLEEVHRNSGDGVHLCHRIIKGKHFQASRKIDIPNGGNVVHVECRNHREAIKCVRQAFTNPPAGMDATYDIQAICPLNTRGPLCREKLNEMVRPLVNSNYDHRAKGFQVGDKVIAIKNQYDEEEEFVANGEQGIVEEKSKGGIVVRMLCPARTVTICDAREWQLGYAITVHKSQGSSWPLVIYVVDDSNAARFVGCRELVYTALSRFEKFVMTVGRKSDIDRDCRNVSLWKRKTFLGELLA